MNANEEKDLALKWKQSEQTKSAPEDHPPNKSGTSGETDQTERPSHRNDRTIRGFSQHYGNEEKQIEIGRNLAALFKQKKIHPVLIFGSKSSGKTMLLASLFKYFHTDDADDANGSIHPCIDAICKPEDEQYEEFEDHFRLANFFLDKIVFRVIKGLAAEATLDDIPFFIPVEVKVTGKQPERYAFLEGKGEWYQPDENPQSENSIKKFKGVISGLLQEFEDSLSVIYVAPCIAGGLRNDGAAAATNEGGSVANCDRGLMGAMDEYMRLRSSKCWQDHQLFLVSKWDTKCGGFSGDEFYNPTDEKIHELIKEKYKLSWKRFSNHLESKMRTSKYAAYCSGKIVDDKMVNLADDDDATVSRYPRRIWNWLYINKTGQYLYLDMNPKAPGILERIARFLRGE